MLVRTLFAILFLLAAPAVAAAADDATLTIRGAGFGHGVGMSQYGALGYAQQGTGYREILGHYYSGTAIGSDGAGKTVRVLLQSTRGAAAFSNATKAGGRKLDPRSTYFARPRAGTSVDLVSSKGRRLATVPAPLRVTSTGPIAVRAKGSYRGALELRPAGAGVNVINAVAMEDYLQGVVPAESPAAWPAEALKAQAVAARTYALTTSKGGAGFDQYDDTRSQVYAGVKAEYTSTNAAVRATRGEVVTYQGRPVTTFFFSTSGGRTENVENTPLGTHPLPWLKSVSDPYDGVSPKHRWGPVRMSLAAAGKKLGGLVQGSFRGIEVVSRGASPRVMAADVVGTKGRTRTTGAVLRARLGLMDTWAFFTTVSTHEETPDPADETGGATASATAAGALRGTILPARRGEVTLEQQTRHGWREVGTAQLRRDGSYRFGLCAKGIYRVRAGSAAGPVVHV
jgi:stage II sporulation protein D